MPPFLKGETMDAIKGLKHHTREVLEAEVTIPSGTDKFYRTQGAVTKAFSAHLFNITGEDYIIRIYRVEQSVSMPKGKKK
jgi:hypothetical protein